MRGTSRLVALLGHSVATLEALNPSSSIDNLLLTREERMAHIADLNLDLGQSRLGLEAVATDTGDRALDIVGMDF